MIVHCVLRFFFFFHLFLYAFCHPVFPFFWPSENANTIKRHDIFFDPCTRWNWPSGFGGKSSVHFCECCLIRINTNNALKTRSRDVQYFNSVFVGSPFLCLSGDTVTSERKGAPVGNSQVQQREEKTRDWGSV